MSSMATPSQTIGPFFGHALPFAGGPSVVTPAHPGALWLRGRLLDGEGQSVTDALLETWQADEAGRLAGGGATPGFRGFGRCPTDDTGAFAFWTVKPGPVRGPGGRRQSPHVAVSVFARGLLDRLVTRVYFADEAQANAEDDVLGRLSASEASTLLAHPCADGYQIELRLQGADATVFFVL